MSEPLSSSVWWLVPLWSTVLLACVAWWLRKHLRHNLSFALLIVLAALAAIPLFPALAAQSVQEPPTQVVYRFDDYRSLELTGWMCEGALTYVDARLHMRTEVASKFYQIAFFPFIHPSARYIVIPWADSLAHITVSRDGGRTFGPDAMIAPGYSPRTKTIPTADDVKQFVVVDDRGYIETKDERVIQSSLPEGNYWGLTYIDYPKPDDVISNDSEKPAFRDLRSKIPEVKNYKGWTHMKCDPKMGIVPPKTSFSGAPGLIYSIEAYTVGAPVYFGWRMYKRMHKADTDADS